MSICMSNIKTTIKFSQHFICITEWSQQQTEFTLMNKCLSKFYVSVRRKEGSYIVYYNRNSLLSVRAAFLIAI